MKTIIFAEKPSQAKAYAEAFTVKSRHKTHIELAESQLFPQGAVIMGHRASCRIKRTKSV